MDEFEVVILGASVAGSMLATLLGRLGLSVALIDARDFSKRKACGEGLSDLGVGYLSQLGLWSASFAQLFHPFFGYSIVSSREKSFNLLSKEPEGFTVNRTRLDSHLYTSACALTAVSPLREKARNAERKAGGWEVELENGDKIRAKQLAGACGDRAPKLLGATLVLPRSTRHRYAWVRWFQGRWTDGMPDTVYIHNKNGSQIIITPLPDSELNLSILSSRNDSNALKTLISQGEAIVSNLGFQPSDMSDPVGASAVHNQAYRCSPQSEYLIGDSIERFDPVGGMGISHAIYSAALAADAIGSTMLHGVDEVTAHARYVKRRNQAALAFRALTDLSYSLNVNENRWITSLGKLAPTLPTKCTGALKKLVRQIPAGRPISTPETEGTTLCLESR